MHAYMDAHMYACGAAQLNVADVACCDACMHEWIHVTYACVSACTYKCMHGSMYACMCAIKVSNVCVRVRMHVRCHVRALVHACLYAPPPLHRSTVMDRLRNTTLVSVVHPVCAHPMWRQEDRNSIPNECVPRTLARRKRSKSLVHPYTTKSANSANRCVNQMKEIAKSDPNLWKWGHRMIQPKQGTHAPCAKI